MKSLSHTLTRFAALADLSHEGEVKDASNVTPDIALYKQSDFLPALAACAGKRVLADPGMAPMAVFAQLKRAGAVIERGGDPCLLPKSTKNVTELEGSRAAHRRDGAALVRFLAWLNGQDKTKLTELAVIDKLAEFRGQSNMYRGPSFETIAGSGPNGAIVHYRANQASNRTLDVDSFLLLDSGAQYLDGTTDITRTIALGEPSLELRQMFTRVLKGHIALATACFPARTSGQQLDALARQFLWQVGANYDHGTGHGVGSYLSVHEGPQRISPRGEAVELLPGMILSNEPGYYKAGAYGIRIENLITVRQDQDGLSFETLSLAPIDRAAIDTTLLTDMERDWLDFYHARVRESLIPLLDAPTKRWLEAATKPL